jgi:YkoY family integral membrane protein
MVANIIIVLNLFILEGLLSIDNAAVLAIMVKDLPKDDSKKALRYGLLGAYLMRGLCLLFASYIMHVGFIKILGGAYLLYLTYGHFNKSVETIEETKSAKETGIYKWLSKIGCSNLLSTIILVEIMDLAFSIDNVFAAVAISNNYWVVIAGVFIGIAAMRFIAGWFVDLLNKHPSLERSAFIVIGLLGVKLIACGLLNLESRAIDMVFSLALIAVFFIPFISIKKQTV